MPYIPKPIVGIFARRYIAGEELQDAAAECQKLNANQTMATIDVLGEFVTEKAMACATVDAYMDALETIDQHKLDANISVKPTSLGASFDEQLWQEHIRKLVTKAASYNNFVRIDMEDHPYTDLTLQSYDDLRRDFSQHVGTVLQAYMKRTYDDADRLSKDTKANFRLCKGIYNEPPEIAYKDGKRINDNFLATLDLLFSRHAYVGIATHDDELINGAFRLIDQYKLPKEQYEFQMLLGVRPELRRQIIAAGHRMRIYVPYGRQWYSYSMRRFKENPAIVDSIIKGFFKK